MTATSSWCGEVGGFPTNVGITRLESPLQHLPVQRLLVAWWWLYVRRWEMEGGRKGGGGGEVFLLSHLSSSFFFFSGGNSFFSFAATRKVWRSHQEEEEEEEEEEDGEGCQVEREKERRLRYSAHIPTASLLSSLLRTQPDPTRTHSHLRSHPLTHSFTSTT